MLNKIGKRDNMNNNNIIQEIKLSFGKKGQLPTIFLLKIYYIIHINNLNSS